MVRARRARGLGLAVTLALATAGPARALSADALEEPDPAPAAGSADEAGAPPDAPEPALEDRLEAPYLEEDQEAEDDAYAAGLDVSEPDPLEPMNRVVFGFNDHVDRWVVEPVARGYDRVVPDPVERAVLRVFANLNSTSIFVNDVLQLDCQAAGRTLGRFVLNSTVGVVGLFDVASRLGIEAHHADFGQTLALAGLDSGPYLVLPLVGPSTARDAVGSIVDIGFRPQTYFLGPTELLMVGTSSGFATRESYLEELEALRQSSVDFYATMRNIYFQRRTEQLRAAGVGAP